MSSDRTYPSSPNSTSFVTDLFVVLQRIACLSHSTPVNLWQSPELMVGFVASEVGFVLSEYFFKN